MKLEQWFFLENKMISIDEEGRQVYRSGDSILRPSW